MNDDEYKEKIKGYSLAELESCLKRIDVDKFESRANVLVSEIESRKRNIDNFLENNDPCDKDTQKEGRRKCPHCGSYSVNVSDLIAGGFSDPAECENCGELACVPNILSGIVLLFLQVGCVVLFFFLFNGWVAGLLSLAVFFGLVYTLKYVESKWFPLWRA